MLEKDYQKIINLDIENLNEQLLSEVLQYYFLQDKSNDEKIFFKNYEIALDVYVDNNMGFLKRNIELLNKFITYYYCLYGKEKVEYILKKININYNYKSEVYKFINFNLSNSKNNLSINNCFTKLNDFYSNRFLDEKYSDINEEVLKEAFDIIFGIDNFTERYDRLLLKRNFIKKHNIDEKIFRDYVCLYGFKYTILNYRVNGAYIAKKNSFVSYGVVSTNLESNIKQIVETDDINVVKKIIYNTYISEATINLIYEKKNNIVIKYLDKKKEILRKVKLATSKLEKECIYTDASKILSIIEKTDDQKLICKIIKKSPIKKYYVSKFISSYRLLETEENQKEISKRIKTRINAAYRELKINDENDNKVKLIFDNIYQLIKEPDLTIKEFAKRNDFSLSTVYSCLNILKEKKPNIYKKIQDVRNKYIQEQNNNLKSQVKFVCDKILNGIELEDGNIKEFDLLDYFFMCKLDYNEFNQILFNLNIYDVNEISKIKKIIIKTKQNNTFDINQELNIKTTLIINNELHEVTKDEKLTVIEYLRSNNLPLYYNLYNVTLRRFISGTLPKQMKNSDADKKLKRGCNEMK